MHGIIFGGLLEDMGMDPNAFSIRRSSGAHKLATYLRQHNYDIEVVDYIHRWKLEELQEFNPPAPAEIINYSPKAKAQPSKTIPESLANVAEISQVNKNIDPTTGDKLKLPQSELLAKSEAFKELEEEAQRVGARLDNKLLEAAKTGDLTDPKRLSGLVDKLIFDKELGSLTGSISNLRKDLVDGGLKFDEITKQWSP